MTNKEKICEFEVIKEYAVGVFSVMNDAHENFFIVKATRIIEDSEGRLFFYMKDDLVACFRVWDFYKLL